MRIAKLHNDAKTPIRATEGSAGYDLYSLDGYVLFPGETKLFRTGIAMEIPDGYFGGIFARSSLASQGIRPANCVGVVDSDYRGEIMVPLYNDGEFRKRIEKGDKIAQMIFIPYKTFEMEEVNKAKLTETVRGEGGFGSTGE